MIGLVAVSSSLLVSRRSTAADLLNGIGQKWSTATNSVQTEIFMNWSSTGGKSGLIKMLMKEHGFSKRKSEKAVNAVF